jgi:microcystin-dependent protein
MSCEAMLGEVRLFAGNYPPKGWAFCEGQLLKIADHGPLFSVIDKHFGGDGVQTFSLPNLRGCVPMHPAWDRPEGPEYVGGYTGGAPVAVVDRSETTANLATGLGLNYIIAIDGNYPARA